jgi:hypothetical protein
VALIVHEKTVVEAGPLFSTAIKKHAANPYAPILDASHMRILGILLNILKQEGWRWMFLWGQ